MEEHMTDTGDQPDGIPEELIKQLDSLDRDTLDRVQSHIEDLLESHGPPTEEEIKADTAGEVLEIKPQGGHALVRKHPPNPDGPGPNQSIVSLYEVRRERYPDGDTGLHWAYIGDVENDGGHRCPSCGRTYQAQREACPHCASGDTELEE